MNMERFQKFLERIDPGLSKDAKKDKIVQIADINRFVESYTTKLTLMGCMEYEINIVEQNGTKTGVLFCDLTQINKSSFNPILYTPFTSDFFREQTNVNTFWFVFVEENQNTPFKQFSEFIKIHQLKEYYSKIFLFRYFESSIHQLT